MPLSTEQKQLKKRIYQALRDKALEPDDEFYVEIYKMAGCVDPIDQLREHIEFTDFESVQFFSGFRGSGKSTELLRLKRDLEEAGYFVVYADALKYINPADEIDITDLLIVLAGAFSDAIEENPNVKKDLQGESYWTRIKNYLVNTNLDITEITPKAGVGSKDTGSAELALKLALQTTPSFRQKLQQHLVNRIGALKEEVDAFFEDGVKAIKRAMSDDTQIVFIFDSLEQIRGSLFNEDDVIKSVERVFSQHHKLLEMPYVHAIYTVPPWLKFVMKNHPKRIEVLPCVKQWHKGEMRKSHQIGEDKFRELIIKRFGADGFEAFFGADSPTKAKTKADRLIKLCGGHFRDLLSLLRETVLHANNFPVGEVEIEHAIASVRSTFLPISKEDAELLAEIERTHSSALKDEYVGRLARLLDTHLVLYFKNGEEWYDIHPLIREEVHKIVKQIQEVKTKE
jgi:hypothetical protein